MNRLEEMLKGHAAAMASGQRQDIPYEPLTQVDCTVREVLRERIESGNWQATNSEKLLHALPEAFLELPVSLVRAIL